MEDILDRRFMQVFPSLPLEERKQTIVVIDSEPISWKKAYEEIRFKTELGKKLIELEII